MRLPIEDREWETTKSKCILSASWHKHQQQQQHQHTSFTVHGSNEMKRNERKIITTTTTWTQSIQNLRTITQCDPLADECTRDKNPNQKRKKWRKKNTQKERIISATCCDSNGHRTHFMKTKGTQKSQLLFLIPKVHSIFQWRSSTAITIIGQWLHQSILLKPIGNLPFFFEVSFQAKLFGVLAACRWALEIRKKRMFRRFHLPIKIIYIYPFDKSPWDTTTLYCRSLARDFDLDLIERTPFVN